MKKIFQIVGLISLTVFSFFITEKTALVVKDLDDIMIEIKGNKDYFKRDAIDAIIKDNTIIPGVRGRTVNVGKSYKAMKTNGYYSEKLYEYDYTNPSISLKDNIDKYIIKGHPTKRMISLIFILKNNIDIKDIIKTLDNYNVKANFFIDKDYLENNDNTINNIMSNGHIIAPFFDNYKDYNYEFMDIYLKKISKKNYSYCLSLDFNDDNITECSIRKNYTILPTIISDKMPLVDIKSSIEPGQILLLSINSELKKELSSIIIYIRSKGYTIKNLDDNALE